MSAGTEWLLMGLSLAGAIAGVLFAWQAYKDLMVPERWAKRWAGLHKTLQNKWYVDEIYEAVFVRPIVALSQALWKGFDIAVIDRIVVVGFGRVSEWTGQTVRRDSDRLDSGLCAGSSHWYRSYPGVSHLWNCLILIC